MVCYTAWCFATVCTHCFWQMTDQIKTKLKAKPELFGTVSVYIPKTTQDFLSPTLWCKCVVCSTQPCTWVYLFQPFVLHVAKNTLYRLRVGLFLGTVCSAVAKTLMMVPVVMTFVCSPVIVHERVGGSGHHSHWVVPWLMVVWRQICLSHNLKRSEPG